MSITMASQFTYKPPLENTIRLVQILPTSDDSEIRCSLIESVAYQTDDIQYTALSYCWGEDFRDPMITLDGFDFPVTENLWLALDAIQDITKIWHHLYTGSMLFVWIRGTLKSESTKFNKCGESTSEHRWYSLG